MTRIFLAAAVLLAIAACGGHPGAQPQPQPRPAPGWAVSAP